MFKIYVSWDLIWEKIKKTCKNNSRRKIYVSGKYFLNQTHLVEIQMNFYRAELEVGTHSCDGVQRVLDGQQQDFVFAGGVVCIGGPGDSLTGGEVEEGLLVCDVDRLSASAGHAALCALHAVELHQGLPLKRHHHHVTANIADRR